MDADRGIYNQGYNEIERLSEQSRFEKSTNSNTAVRKHSGPLSMRSMRKESKTKPTPFIQALLKSILGKVGPLSSLPLRPTIVSEEAESVKCEYVFFRSFMSKCIMVV
ncbi:hypothetical protein OSTOST_20499 [Ostertagia ostertagi]